MDAKAWVSGRSDSSSRLAWNLPTQAKLQPRDKLITGCTTGDPVATALLAGSHGHGLPVGTFFVGPLAAQAQHAAFGHQGLDAGNAQLGGFFDQPVHAVIGGHAHGQMDLPLGFSLYRKVSAHLHLHVAAPHAGDGGFKLAAVHGATEQRDHPARLHAQHLHVARGAGGQVDQLTGLQGCGAVESGHVRYWLMCCDADEMMIECYKLYS